MTELEIIEQLRRRMPVRDRNLVLGIGDDCAIYRPRGSREDLLFTTDQLIEGVHFRAGLAAARIGYKAVARALSDVAAMGGRPRFCLISIAAPRRFDLEGFFRGVRRVADRFHLTIAGGDLARSNKFTCDVVICGAAPRGSALTRKGARVGDDIYVSGPLGGNAARSYRDLPSPRIEFGRKLRGRATACMDVSDGLAIDLYRLCKASQVGAFLHQVPRADKATEEQALRGGEDYELLYTGRGLPGIRIGVINDDPPGLVTFNGYPLAPAGWDHFALQ
jgi:thiamine-monophosphate kinase